MKLIKYLFWVLLLMGSLVFLVKFNELNQFENKFILNHPKMPVVATGGFLDSVISFILLLFKLYTSIINIHKDRYC